MVMVVAGAVVVFFEGVALARGYGHGGGGGDKGGAAQAGAADDVGELVLVPAFGPVGTLGNDHVVELSGAVPDAAFLRFRYFDAERVEDGAGLDDGAAAVGE